mgnify:CR=1 FL=1
MSNLPKIALGAWAWGNDGTFGNDFTAETLKPIFDAAMAVKLRIMPHTVPNRPTKGATEPMVASVPIFSARRSIL